MAFDYKKEYKEYYLPSNKPSIIKIPKMNFLAVRGKGDPNIEDGEYKRAIGKLYSVAYTLKMSKNTSYKIEGYFDYIVPPLEGFWWIEGEDSNGDYSKKDRFSWISLIRLPDFIKKEDFDWAIKEATTKKKSDFSDVEFFVYDEGLSVQSMHIGSYDNEKETIRIMNEYANKNGYSIEINENRYHHEIYISDPRKCDVSKVKTIIRHPIK